MYTRSPIAALLFLLIGASAVLHGQDYFWDHQYGGDKQDWGTALIHTSDGGFLVLGGSQSIVGGPRATQSGYVVKTDSLGVKQWEQAVGTASYTAILAGHEMPDGGYLVIGFHQDRDNDPVQLARFDHAGTILWQRSFGSDTTFGYDTFFDVNAASTTTDYGFLLAGRSFNGKVAYWRVDSLGAPIWHKGYQGVAPDPEFKDVTEVPFCMRELADGGAIITGYTTATVDGNRQAYALRLDAKGDSLWWRVYGTLADEEHITAVGRSVVPTADGFVIVGGARKITDSYPYESLVLHIANGGAMLGGYAFNDVAWGVKPGQMWLASIRLMPGGGFVAVGTVMQWTEEQPRQSLLALLDDQGRLIRAVGVGKTGDAPEAYDVVALPGERFAIAGWTGGSPQTQPLSQNMLLMMVGPRAASGVGTHGERPTKMDLSELLTPFGRR